MKFKPLMLATFLILSFITNVANALTPEQENQISKQMQKLENNLQTGKAADFVWQLPPKVRENLAKEAKVTPQELAKQMRIAMQPIASQIVFSDFHYGLSHHVEGQTASHQYVIFPIEYDMATKNKSAHVKETVLALYENNQWYIMRLQSPKSLQILKSAYPDLANVQLPK